jgi:hypothetical protein
MSEWEEPKSAVTRNPDAIFVTYGRASVFVDRLNIARDKSAGGPYLLLSIPAVAASYSPHGNVLTLHLPYGLVGELLVAMKDASDEVAGEICWIEEQDYEAAMAELDFSEAAEEAREARPAEYESMHGTFVIDTGDE